MRPGRGIGFNKNPSRYKVTPIIIDTQAGHGCVSKNLTELGSKNVFIHKSVGGGMRGLKRVFKTHQKLKNERSLLNISITKITI